MSIQMSNSSAYSRALERQTQAEIADEKARSASTYGRFAGYCMTVNYCVGTGFLSLAWASYEGGLGFFLIYLAVVSLLAFQTARWLVEVCGRAEAVSSRLEEAGVDESRSLLNVTAAGSSTGALQKRGTASYFNPVPDYEISMRKFEVNDLCRLFLGPAASWVYLVTVWIYFSGGLVSYATVFAQSFSSNVPVYLSGSWYTCDIYQTSSADCNGIYLIYLGLFSLMVVPLACRDLTEQKSVQILLTVLRFVAIFLITGIMIWAMYNDPYSTSRHESDSLEGSSTPYVTKPAFVRSGLVIVVPLVLYAQVMHHSVPSIIQPLVDKASATGMFRSMFVSSFVLYMMITIVMSLYYGKHIEPTASLNFAYFRGGASFSSSIPWWAHFVSYFLVLFPAFDTASAYPLNALSLGSNLMMQFSSRSKRKDPSRKRKLFFRLLASIPPIGIAAVVHDLDTILQYAGLIGFMILLIFPALLLIASRRKCRKLFGERYIDTPYSSSLSREWVACLVIVFGIGSMAITLAGIVDPSIMDS